jgi:uncharacterized protein YbaR (Trm112 family)
LANDRQLDILRCPACVNLTPEPSADPGQLELVDDRWLVCRDCGRRYPIRGGPGAAVRIPVLLIDQGNQNRAGRAGR